jgi:uncharacterized protein involved in oxidation of intracellular sulfur
MNILIIINDAPYGTEKAYNAMRLVNHLSKNHEHAEVRIFLMADATSCAVGSQNTPNKYYNIERMLKTAIDRGVKVNICSLSAESRGLQNVQLIEGVELSTLSQLANFIVHSDKVLTF